ncbi:MAG: hypothetical protein M1812_007459 [Candelaria pacifica]|nr:MAG: hypothetical protein M1812_007459 [Candelaria pacifica]
MGVTLFAAAGTASAVLALSKAAWKLGSSLSNLHQDTNMVDTTARDLAEEVKSLGNECDMVYAELEEMMRKSETPSPLPCDVDGRLWNCLVTQVDEASRAIQELELFVKSVRGERSNPIRQAQRQREIEGEMVGIRRKVGRHTDNLRTTLLLITTVRAHIAPCRADQGLAKELDKLQDVLEKLRRSSEANPQLRPSHTEATLAQCAREVIVEGTTMYEATRAAESVAGGRGAASSITRVAEWVSTLDSIRRDQRLSDPSDMASNVPSIFSGDETHTVVSSTTSAPRALQEREAIDAVWDDPDDDLDTDLAKAALDTGTKAFEAQDWEEAESLLQEALKVLQQLPKQQRAFCDIFGLQYKLAVCTYHTQEPADAEEALMSLIQQSASSDQQRGYICDAAHLLSHLYIRMGQLDRARSECEKALQARRRLLGKQSDASLESTALMAHIHVLLNNRARAKSLLAMIPEARRDAVLKIVEDSLGTKVENLNSSSPRPRSVVEDSEMAVKRIQSGLSTSSLASPTDDRCYGPISSIISQSPTPSPRQLHERTPSNTSNLEDLRSVTVTSLSSTGTKSGSEATERGRVKEDYFVTPSPGKPPEANEISKVNTLSRKEILNKIGCQPKDRIEEAVCDGDRSAIASLLNKRNDFWRSKVRKRVRPERVTALHFAALFGEIDIAQQLLGSGFNVNEAPFGYSTSLTPLKFAIGARQVDMVDFLITNGAKPSEPDSWSTLASQLMNGSWLKKTLSEAEKEHVSERIIAILGTLIKSGWDLNMPFETSGRTLLHQAVTLWMGSFKWDLSLRTKVTSFLCERGANPFQPNKEGKTAYDLASAAGHQDLLPILDQGSTRKESGHAPPEPVELSSEQSISVSNPKEAYKARVEMGTKKDWIRGKVKNGR